ncbi:TBC1 domain family member 13-like [Mercenaria mercenaria]|uniref:TBC1 domain family member 13-like n=1 Tax=Mercenaria mercenaria TaxID=6596 RepID=UPI00234F1555|nr:TBC1 domain family member 13-like [Mercenaria mercenaria]
MSSYKARVEEFRAVLDAEVIDFKKLRKNVFNGCPFEAGLRPKCWKLLLYYLPKNRSEWDKELKKQRATYVQFIDEMIIKPGTEASENGGVEDVTFEDHPLNPNPESKWRAYFKDNEMLLQIDKDCRRLCPDLNFFQRATEYPCNRLCGENSFETLRKRVEQCVLHSESVSQNRLGITNMATSRRKASDEYMPLPDGQEAHWEVCERILFVYAKLNPGLGYIQGMNEILGPIYYTFASDSDKDCKEFAEADSFFCFTNLMSEIRDNFIKTLDDSQCGIGNLMNQLMTTLKETDSTLWYKLKEQDLKPQFYAFRWLTLLLSQEFPLPDVLRIWDSLFADDKRFNFLIKVGCAMLLLLKQDLLMGDFPHNMKLVQNFPYTTIDVQVVIKKAVEIR